MGALNTASSCDWSARTADDGFAAGRGAVVASAGYDGKRRNEIGEDQSGHLGAVSAQRTSSSALRIPSSTEASIRAAPWASLRTA